MKCQQGDLAIIVHSPSGLNVNKIVEVCSYQGEHSQFGPVWRVRTKGSELITEYGAKGITCDVPDAWLTPLRDKPGEDETLTFKPKVEEV